VSARRNFWLAATAGALATLAAVAGSPAAPGARVVGALELAGWIRDRRPGLRIVDLRDSAAWAAGHVPSAVRVPAGSLGTTDGTPVLYAEDDERATRVARGVAGALVLGGGVGAWEREVLDARLLADSASTPAAREADARAAALSRYFGGVPRAMPRADSSSGTPARVSDDALVWARIRSRGC
jgi:hypothetical protein